MQSHPRILIVDDDPIVADSYAEFLREEGYQTATACDGREAMDLLCAYDWPGNVRELENLIERLVVLCAEGEIRASDLPAGLQRASAPIVRVPQLTPTGLPIREVMEEFESALILQALELSHGNKNQAARLLGLNRTTLLEKRTHLAFPRYSPDGRRIAFFGKNAQGDTHLFVMNSDATNLRAVTDGAGELNIMPQWGGDDRSLYFYQARPRRAFRRVSLADGISEDVAPWSWSRQPFADVDAHGRTAVHSVIDRGQLHESRLRNLESGAETTLPFALYLPTYAATARYHGKVPKKYASMDLGEFLDEVGDYALGEYWTALAKGDLLDEKTRQRVAARLQAYTGLSPAFLDKYDLRIHIMRFCKELLADRKRTVGRLDSRYVGIDRPGASESLENDPSGDATRGVAASALNTYLREEIGFETDDIYRILEADVWKEWDYEDFKGRYVDTSENFRDLLSRSRGTKVLFANGYYDLATPHFATEYTISHMGLDPEVRQNVQLTYYEAGHMMYVHQPSLRQLAADLRQFITSTL